MLTQIEKKIEDKENELLHRAELLMELRGYQKEQLKIGEEAIDIKASKPDSKETVLLHVITKSKLKRRSVGVKKVEEAKQILKESNIQKMIVFGNKFTKAARKALREEGIEHFSMQQKAVSILYQQDPYPKILYCVDKLCQIKCGYVPRSVDECKGYSEKPVICSFCDGSGKQPTSHEYGWELKCPVCGGVGSKDQHYSCQVRLISDNADFHYKLGWINTLQYDLLSLLKMLISSRPRSEERITLTHAQKA